MVDPRMPTDPVAPPFAGRGLPAWLAAEAWHHLWPFSREGFARHRVIQAAGFALALATLVAWILAGIGRIEAVAIIAWWFGWSVFEVIVRMGAKPWVKEGPWWRRHYRAANTMDMICYVGFKNLLIGATLFLALKWAGLLVI